MQLIARSSVKLSKLNNGLYAMLGRRKTRTARSRARVVVEVETHPTLPPPPTGRGRRRCLAVRSQGGRINSHWRERRARRRETPRHGSAGCRFRGDLPFARRTSARIFSPAGGVGAGRCSWPQLCDRLSFVGPLSSGPKGWVEVAEVRSVQRCLRLCRPANLELSGHAWALPSVIVAPAECQAICSALLLA